MNPTLIAQATLQKGDRLLFAMGMAPTVQAAHIALINSAINLQKAVERLDAHYSEPIMAALTIKLPRVGGER